jgi:TRAP-type C4-dicarboxylate transport system permease small subunit
MQNGEGRRTAPRSGSGGPRPAVPSQMIDRILEELSRAIERALALAFVFAVALNFANVVGRYALGTSILGADDVQIYVMVGMAFLGAAVVSWRRRHLRMDVLVQFFPARFRTFLQAAEFTLCALLAGFVLVQSSNYAANRSIIDGLLHWRCCRKFRTVSTEIRIE